MKRFLSLMVVASLVLSAAVIPASAAGANYGIYNLLDYSKITSISFEYEDYSGQWVEKTIAGGSNSVGLPVGTGTVYITYHNPAGSMVYGISGLINLNRIDSISCSLGDLSLSDTDYSTNTKFYEIEFYNKTGGNGFYNDTVTLEFDFDVSIGGAKLEFLSIYVKTAYDSTVRTPIQIYDTIHSTTETFSASAASHSYTVNMNYGPTNQAGIAAGLCTIRLRPLATEGTFDFWDLNFEVTGINITSISCLQGDKSLDFDVGYTYMDSSGTIIVNPDSQGAGDTLTNTYARVWVSLRVYTKAANFIEGWPLVFINGTSTSAITDGLQWNITFYPSYVGYNVSIFDPYVMWLNKIYSALHPEGAVEAADKFTDKVKEQSEQLNQMVGTMDSVQKPSLDSVQSDISAIVPQGDMVLATAPLGTLLGNEIIVTIFSISLLFVMVSYILFGKKG